MPVSYVHVAVAAIVNRMGEVLTALRSPHQHQGDLWEFPGGKVEAGETAAKALIREISEELDIIIDKPVPLIQIRHDYPDKSVMLDVFRVDSFTGIPKGQEGQRLEWKKINELEAEEFPKANMPVIKALQLPAQYMITGQFSTIEDFERKLEQALISGIKIVQLRCKGLADDNDYLRLAASAENICHKYNAVLLLNTRVDVFNETHADGLHLNSQRLFEYSQRPVSADKLLSVSCHTIEEMAQAEKLGADILLLSPVKETTSHPGVAGIGWHRFKKIVENVSCPVYALGGMTVSDLDDARQAGAQGVAAISSFWPK